MDKNIIQDQITGLKEAISALRTEERQHIKAATLQEQIDKLGCAREKTEAELSDTKEALKEKKAEREALVSKSTDQLALAITKLLPVGDCYIAVEDGSFSIGWKTGDARTPYSSLSGGEKVAFDIAMSNALLADVKNKIIIGELAECDDDALTALLEKVVERGGDAQYIFSTCHMPVAHKLPKEFNVVRV